MAYKPISQTTQTGGYVPISQKKPTKPIPTLPQALDSMFPYREMVRNASLPKQPAPPQTLNQQIQKADTDKVRGTTISAPPKPERSLIGNLTEAIPGNGMIERGIEKYINKPFAKLGSFLRNDPNEYYRQAVAENPGATSENVYQKALELRRSKEPGFVGDDLGAKQIDVEATGGLIRKVGSTLTKKLLESIIGASSKEAAEKVARDILPTNPTLSQKFSKLIVEAKDETAARNVYKAIQDEATKTPTASTLATPSETPKSLTSKSAYKPIVVKRATEPQPDPLALHSSVSRRLEELEVERAILDDTLKSNTAGSLVKKMGRGDNTLSQLQENAIKRRKNITQFDDVDELGFVDLNEAQKAVEQYKTSRKRLQEIDSEIKEMRRLDRDLFKFEKQQLKSLEQYAEQTTLPEQPSPVLQPLTKPKTKSTYKPIKAKAPTKTTTLQPKKELPSLPKLSPEIAFRLQSKMDDATVNEAIRTRYRNLANRPNIPNDRLAKLAQKDGGGEGVGTKVMKVAGELLTPISSRLRRINPILETGLRKMEFAVNQRVYKDMQSVLPLINGSKKMGKIDNELFSLARLNGDREVYEALARKYGLEDQLKATEKTIADIRIRANEVGMDMPKRDNYFTRIVKNPDGYIAWWRSNEDWGKINRLIEAEAEKKGIKVTDLWKDKEKVASIINNYVRGYGNKTVLGAPSFAKGRKINVLDEELAKFYESSDEALTKYIIRMNDEIEARRFFGKKADGDADIEDSIGAYVLKLVADNKIKPQQQDEVSDILKSRFQRGSMNGALDLYRNLEYISTMGNPISAVTQIGDFAWSLYDNGFFRTAKAALGKKKITREEIGFDQSIMNEFTRDTMSGKAVSNVFKITGLDKLSRLGQETMVNANFAKYKKRAQQGDPGLEGTLARLFDPAEADLAMKEFAEGKVTERTKFVVFNRLLDFQPLTKSEMPQVYLERPNGRLFYMLKTFTLKQYDIARREAFDKIATSEPKQVAVGMKNLIHLAAVFMLANATADEIKDLILGREAEPSDRLIDNLYRLIGASKFDIYQAREDGIGTATMRKLLFPASIIDRAYRDITNMIEGREYERGELEGEKYKLESTQTIPLGGKLYYWWFGRGAQKEEYKESLEKDDTTVGLPTLPTLPTLPSLPTL